MRKIDLTLTAKRWNRLQMSAAIAMFIAFEVIASNFFAVLRYLTIGRDWEADYFHIGYAIGTTLIATYVIRQLWTHGILLNARSLGKLRLVFWIGLWCSLAHLLWAAQMLRDLASSVGIDKPEAQPVLNTGTLYT
jgi:hypothetical protein